MYVLHHDGKIYGKKFPFDLLKKEGFAHDFIKGSVLLSETNGGSFNTNPFIQVL